MAKALYLDDSYLKECDAKALSVTDGKYVILDQTVFHTIGGGQPWDTGQMIRGDEAFNVVYVREFNGAISHEADRPGLTVGDRVHCVLDWDRRYRLMRSHTVAHVLITVLNQRTGALVTGNQLDVDRARIDFNLPNFDRQVLNECIEEANRLVNRDLPVRTYLLPRSEALKIRPSEDGRGLPARGAGAPHRRDRRLRQAGRWRNPRPKPQRDRRDQALEG